MNDYLQLALVVVLSISFGFQLGYLVTSYQYEVCHGYFQSQKRDGETGKIKSSENSTD